MFTSENHTYHTSSPDGSESVLDFSNVDEISRVCHMTSQTPNALATHRQHMASCVAVLDGPGLSHPGRVPSGRMQANLKFDETR